MKKLKIFGSVFIALALLISSFASPVQAVNNPNWDISGNWVINMEYQDSDYPHDVSFTQNDAGDITGSGGSPAGANVYTWTITSGLVSGNSIDFLADYTATADAVTPQTTIHVMGTIASDGKISGTWSDNYQGETRSGAISTESGAATLLGSLAAEDFGVVDYDTGLGILRGYTAGFGLTDANFEDVQSVVVKLYAGPTLLQTNTATALVGDTIVGSQISSPFDVSGSFAYGADGYWTNVRESEYGQSIPATRVVADVILENGKVLTAENTNLTGDPITIYPPTSFTLAVLLAGSGTGSVTSSPAGIACGIDCSQSYIEESSVTLTADAAVGSTFTGWTGSGCAGTGTCTVDMTQARSVTATFTLDSIETHTITASAGTHGSISPSGAVSVDDGDDKTFTITADSDYHINNVLVDGISVGAVGTYTFNDVIINHTISATFAEDTEETNTLAVAFAGSGTGSVTSFPAGIDCSDDCSEDFTDGIAVILLADAAVGSTFTGWTGDCTGMDPCGLIISSNKSVTATFTLDEVVNEPSSKDACKKDGWKTFTDPSFKNQGQCVSYVNHHGDIGSDGDSIESEVSIRGNSSIGRGLGLKLGLSSVIKSMGF